MRKVLLFFLFVFFLCTKIHAQFVQGTNFGNSNNTNAKVKQHAKWKYELNPTKVTVGQEIELILTADIEEGWYLYSSDFDPNLGPIVTSITFKKNDGFQAIGKLKAIHPKRKFDDIWGGEVSYFIEKAEFRQKIKVLKQNPTVEATVEYQTCTIKDGACVGGEYDFSVNSKQLTVISRQSSVVSEEKPGNSAQETTTEKADTITVNRQLSTVNDTPTTHNPQPTTHN